MAKVTGQLIPPSLAALYKHNLFTMHPYNDPRFTVGASNNIFARYRKPGYQTIGERAAFAANWLADNHAGGVSSSARVQFVADRKAEILDSNFPVEFWHKTNRVSERVSIIEPFSSLDPGAVDPQYADPLRQSSRPNYIASSTFYPLPAPYSPAPIASPGWRGEVASLMYADKYSSEYVSDHDLGERVRKPGDALFWGVVNLNFEMSSSFRGVRLWPTVNVYAVPWFSVFTQTTAKRAFHGHTNRRNMYRYAISADATPWSQTISYPVLIDFAQHHAPRWFSTTRYFSIFCAPIPPLGRYFARNDWCQLWLTATVDLYRSQTVLS